MIAAGQPGSEILAPLAVVVLGGLLSSTFLDLLIVPAGFFLLLQHHRQPEPVVPAPETP